MGDSMRTDHDAKNKGMMKDLLNVSMQMAYRIAKAEHDHDAKNKGMMKDLLNVLIQMAYRIAKAEHCHDANKKDDEKIIDLAEDLHRMADQNREVGNEHTTAMHHNPNHDVQKLIRETRKNLGKNQDLASLSHQMAHQERKKKFRHRPKPEPFEEKGGENGHRCLVKEWGRGPLYVCAAYKKYCDNATYAAALNKCCKATCAKKCQGKFPAPLVATIFKATQLPASDLDKTSDPYVVGWIGSNPKDESTRVGPSDKTPHKENDLEPDWSEDFLGRI